MGIFLGIIFFLFLSALFSGAEIAFISSNRLGIEVLKDKGTRRAKIISGFYNNSKSFLSSALVGNNIALVVFTILFTKVLSPVFSSLSEDSPLLLFINTILITLVVLIFGEFLPKTFARLYSHGFLHLMAYPLLFFKWFLAFPTWCMTKLSNLLFKLVMRTPVERVDEALSMLDLQHFINQEVSEEDDSIDKEILTNALNLNQLKVRDCMIPRTEVASIDVSDSLDGALQVFKESKHSRLIVEDGDMENVIGYIHHQQLLDSPRSVKSMVMMMPYVPEAMNVQHLLTKFIAERTNIACAVDEFGGTAGIITLEDILEEIFGEIEDEHDVEDNIDIRISENEFLFSGRSEIDLINEKYDILDLPEGEYHTLSGYIVMTSGTIPEKGSEVELDGYKFVFEAVSDKKIETVRVIKLSNPDQEDS